MRATEFSFRRINAFIVIVSLLMMLVVLNLPFKTKPFGDITFHAEAKNMALFLKGKMPYEKVTVTRAPGPVFFYTPAYLIAPSDATDNDLWIYGVVFTSILITISMILIFRTGASFFSKEVGLLSVLLFFIFPIHCYYSLGIMAEAPAFFSLAVAIYGWSVACGNPEKKNGWILMLLGMAFLIMNRPNAMLLPGLGLLVVFYAGFKNKSFFDQYGKKLTLTLIGVIALSFAGLQVAKNITAGKTNEDQEGLFYYVANEGRFQFREEPLDLRYWDDKIRGDSKDYQNWVLSMQHLSEEAYASGRKSTEVYREFLINDAFQHPFWFVRQFVVKCFYGHMYIINSIQPQDFKMGPLKGTLGYAVFIVLINLINILIIFGAIVFLVKEKKLINYWIFWGVIVALLIFHGLTYMEPRYIFPSKVALYIMSAAGLYQLGFIRRRVDQISSILIPKKSSHE